MLRDHLPNIAINIGINQFDKTDSEVTGLFYTINILIYNILECLLICHRNHYCLVTMLCPHCFVQNNVWKEVQFLKNKTAVCGVPNNHIAALVLVIVALILHVIGFSAPSWYFQKFTKTKSYSGLWRACVSISVDLQYVHMVPTCLVNSHITWLNTQSSFCNRIIRVSNV